MEEGVDFTFYASPKEVVLGEDGRAVSVEMIKTVLGANRPALAATATVPAAIEAVKKVRRCLFIDYTPSTDSIG